MVTLTFFFLGVNQIGPKSSSTSNPTFYKAVGWLHGPWCKQPLRLDYIIFEIFAIDSGAEWTKNQSPLDSTVFHNMKRTTLACDNVHAEPVFSVMAGGWFCEKSGWIGKVEDVKLVL